MLAFAQRKQIAFALAAAMVFVLQAIGSAWADRSVPLLDAFGNPLCVNNDAGEGGPHQSDHGKQTNCCTLACANFAATALDPQGNSEVVRHLREIAEPFGGDRNIRADFLASNKQGNPRAPPIAI